MEVRAVEFESNKSVIVIGGGIAGISTALYLAEAGMRVTCLESNSDIAMETSHMNGALSCASRTKPWCSLKNVRKGFVQSISPFNSQERTIDVVWSGVVFSADFWKWFANMVINAVSESNYARLFSSSYRLSTFSLLCMEDIHEKIAAAGNLESVRGSAEGTLQLFQTEDSRNQQYTELFTVVDGLRTVAGAEVSILEPALSQAHLFPGGAIHSAIDRSYDIHKICTGIKHLAQRKGVTFVVNQRISKVSFRNMGDNKVVDHIVTDAGSSFSADSYVVATGHNSNDIAKLAGDGNHSWPIRGFVVEVPVSSEPGLKHNIVYDQRGIYLAPLTPTTVRLSGYCEIGPQYPDKSQPVDWSIALRLLDQARALLPAGYLAPSTHPAIRVHTCWRPQTPDDLPVVGASAHVQNLYYNSGHGHLGLTRAVGSAKLLSEVIVRGRVTSTDTIDMNDYRPDRFQLLNFCQVSRMLKKIF